MILFIAPMPPPVNGYSLINQFMLERLRKVAPVVVVDRTRGAGGLMGLLKGVQVVGCILRCLVLILCSCLFRSPRSAYIGVSGGNGQLIDVLMVLLIRLFGVKAYYHHHSFSYLNRVTLINKIYFSMLGSNNIHVVLCERMKGRLMKQYGIPASRVMVVSNISFLGGGKVDQGRRKPGPVVLGFLSNISREKGIFLFFDAFERIVMEGVEVKGVIAGPLPVDIEKEFCARLDRFSQIEYLGPVYGAEKKQFLAEVDLLLFPTMYPNEAEPLTIYEALGQGVNVISFGRGCIPDYSLGSFGSCVEVGREEEFISAVLEWVRNYSSQNVSQQVGGAIDAYNNMLSSSAGQLSNLINLICNGKDVSV